jgi:uncharacterized protein YegP (UPF0339 family)
LCPDLACPNDRDNNENTSNIGKEPGGKRVAAKFEIRQPKAGEFRWVLVSQGRTLATSESYTRKVSAEKAIESLRKAAATATVNDTTAKPAKKVAAAKTTVKRAARTVAKTVAAPVKKAPARKRTPRKA